MTLSCVCVVVACLQLLNDRKLIPLYVLDSILKNVKPRGVYSALVIQVQPPPYVSMYGARAAHSTSLSMQCECVVLCFARSQVLTNKHAKKQNLTRFMAKAFMAVDNNFKPKFIKLLKTWDENKIFPDAKIHEVRDTMMLMLTNGGVFPVHLNANGGQGPQMGGNAQMAQGPIDVESSYSALNNSYHSQQGGGMHADNHYNMGGQIDSYGQYAAHDNCVSYGGDTQLQNNRPSNVPPLRAADAPPEHSGPRILCPKELARFLLLLVSTRFPSIFCILMETSVVLWRDAQCRSAIAFHRCAPLEVNPGPRTPFSLCFRANRSARIFSCLSVACDFPENATIKPLDTYAECVHADLSSRDISDIVHSLYEDRPHMCKKDGRRFREKRELEQHLDDLFAKNKIRKERSAMLERLWFRHADEWSRALDITSVNESASATDNMEVKEETAVVEQERSVVAGDDWGDGLKCVACHEELKKVWDGESDEWVFRGVVHLDTSSTGRPCLVHQTCHRDSALNP